ncbi:unnamed protein product, partial [Medioppia subpectinata]
MGAGHMNASIGIAEHMIAAGHRVLFTVNEHWLGRLSPHGIEEVLLADYEVPFRRAVNTEYVTRQELAATLFSGESPVQKVLIREKNPYLWIEYNESLDDNLGRLLPDIRPDVIVLNQLATLPAMELSGVPCVWSWSVGPLNMVKNERAPPGESGLSATGDQELWREFRQSTRERRKPGLRAFNQWVVGRGCEPLPEHCMKNGAKYLNIYGFPRELDYQDIRPLGRNYVQFDGFMRSLERNVTLRVPPELAANPGALVYVSFSTIVSMDVSNMRRLVAILAKSQHRFIVLMGPKHK